MTRFQFVLYNRVLKHFSLEFVLPPKLELREKSLKYIRFRTILTISSLYKLFSAYKAGNTHNDCRESIRIHTRSKSVELYALFIQKIKTSIVDFCCL